MSGKEHPTLWAHHALQRRAPALRRRRASGTAPLAVIKVLVRPQARCGGACGGAPQSGVLNACGGLFWDSGEDLHVGTALDNYVSFTAQLTWQAQVGPPPAAPDAAPAMCNDH